MLHKKIRIPKDSEVEVMEELGKMEESIQFVDLNQNDLEQRKIYSKNPYAKVSIEYTIIKNKQ